MFVTINNRKFWWSMNQDMDNPNITITFIDDKFHQELILISGGDSKWTVLDVFNRLEQYSNMSINDLRSRSKGAL